MTDICPVGKFPFAPDSFTKEQARKAIRSVFKTFRVNEDGYCDWETPIMEKYRMACCDCGLVHNVDFQVLKIVKHNDDGTWDAEEMDPEDYRVGIRMQRNNRSTGQMRRYSNK